MASSNDIGTPVELYIYDLTHGMASIMSPMLIEQPIDGIWHTSVIAYGMEYFFGASGIQTCTPGSTILGEPHRKENLGETFVPYIVFRDYIQALGESAYAGSAYNLINHNCNHFSDEVAQFLCGVPIPKYIVELPDVLLNTPLGQTLRPLLDQLEHSAQQLPINHPVNSINVAALRRSPREPSPDFVELNSQIEEVRYNSLKLEERRNSLNEKLARKERKKEKKRLKLLREGRKVPPELQALPKPSQVNNIPSPEITNIMADSEVNGAEAQPIASAESNVDIEEQERKDEEERKKNREPPVIFKDAVDIKAEYDALSSLLDGKLSPEEHQSLAELHQYMLEDEGSWALGDNFLNFIGRLLHDKSLSPDIRIRILRILGAAALKDDVILLLHQDRKEHVIMNFAHDVDRLSLEEQKAVSLFFANMFENLSSSEWLMYISEWTYCNQQASNIRVTTKVAVHSLLADDADLQDRGSAIIHNLACKEVKTVVFDDVAVELTMALLQYFNSKPKEEQMYRCMKALSRFVLISGQEVPQLIQMIGPCPTNFKGTSERIDELIAQISKKLR